MNADEYAEKMLSDGKYGKHTKEFIKQTFKKTKKPTWEGFHKATKKILWNIFKLFFMYWIFTTKFLPTVGMEKTAIFLILIVITLLINLNRKQE